MTSFATAYKSFPPGLGQLRVPLSSRDAALAGLTLYSSCHRWAALAHHAAWASVRLLGPRILPGRAESWLPVPTAEWEGLRDMLRAAVGDFDEVAGYRRTDGNRDGAALLLVRRGRPLAFVKIRRNGADALAAEERATRLAWRAHPASFGVPEPLALGGSDGLAYLVFEPLPSRLHRIPCRPPLTEILHDVGSALRELPRPTLLPEHWVPMHGDFTPWNLRELERDTRVLIDWEDAGWGPPGADETLYRATLAALRGDLPGRTIEAEAIDYWRRRITHRPGAVRDRALDRAILRALTDMEHTL